MVEVRPWKGFDTSRPPVFLSFDAVDRMVLALLEPIAAWRPDAVAGIARGGLIPAVLLAGHLGVTLFTIGLPRRGAEPAWVGPSPEGGRVLVVDDCCSSGETLGRARALAERSAAAVAMAAIVFDPEVARVPPDFGHPMSALFRLPWERGEATAAARLARASGAVDPAAEAPVYGVVGGVPAEVFGRSRTIAIPLDADAIGMAGRSGCTHLVLTEASDAIRFAALAPHLVVLWWSAAEGRAWVVGASAADTPSRAGGGSAGSR